MDLWDLMSQFNLSDELCRAMEQKRGSVGSRQFDTQDGRHWSSLLVCKTTIRTFLLGTIYKSHECVHVPTVFVPWHLQRHLDATQRCEDKGHFSLPDMGSEVQRNVQIQSLESDNATSAMNSRLVKLYRYYHVFREDEIKSLCSRAAHGRVIDVSFDANNWVILMEKKW